MKIVKPVPVTQAGTFSRASTGTYYDNNGVLQTAAIDTPRYTYDPSDLKKAPVFLKEDAATNYARNNPVAGSTGFDVIGTTNPTFNAAVGPSGSATATKVACNNTPTDAYFGCAVTTGSPLAGKTFTLSVWVWTDAGQRTENAVNLWLYDGGQTDIHTSGDRSISTTPTRITYTVTFAQSATSASLTGRINVLNLTPGAYVYVDGWQIEEGPAATSYIPTTTASVFRAADTITGTGFITGTLPETDYAAYSNSTGYTLGQRVIVPSEHKIYESLRGGSSTVTISFASPAVIGWKAHGLPNGSPVTFTTTGTLPAGLTSGTTYYVINANTDTFNVAATLGGSAINTTSAGSGVHTGNDAANLNHTPSTSPTYWLDCGSTNRWKPFDAVVQSQMTATTSAAFTTNVPALIDTVALLNVNAQQARVVAHYGSEKVYDANVSLFTDEVEITDWSMYFFTDFRQQTDVILNDLPPYLNMNVSVSLASSAGDTVGLGAVIYGKAKDISSEKKGVELGAKVGITDYSVKTKDAFGNYTITPRAFAKRANWDVYVNNEDIDFTFNLLSSIRATPILFIGSGQYKATAIYGYYKQWEVSIPYPDVSICTLEIDGLV